MAKTGRPSKYTPKLGDKICSLIIRGYTLRNIGAQKGLPSKTTMMRWLSKDVGTFRNQYARAKEMQAELMAEEIADIADDGTNDWAERQAGDGKTYEVVDHEHIQRSKLRVDTRKWLMSKLIPKKYGDRISQEHSGPDGGPIKTEHQVAVTFVNAEPK